MLLILNSVFVVLLLVTIMLDTYMINELTEEHEDLVDYYIKDRIKLLNEIVLLKLSRTEVIAKLSAANLTVTKLLKEIVVLKVERNAVAEKLVVANRTVNRLKVKKKKI